MLDDILFIVSLVLEVIVLAFFINYTFKYLKQYHEKVDPYTKYTLILLTVSMIIQLLRIPLTVLKMVNESIDDPQSEFSQWYISSESFRVNFLNVVVFLHGNLQKSAILINILRWQILVISLYNQTVQRFIQLAKMLCVLTAVVMVLSSYVTLMRPFPQPEEGGPGPVNYLLGNFINGYLINLWVIFAYLYIFIRLKAHYDSVQFQYAKFISSYEQDQMRDTLRALAIFFSAICQCFLYRIFQRAVQDLFPEQFGGLIQTSTQTAIITVFYFSEMIMIVGICISINKSIETAKHSGKNAQASQAVNGMLMSSGRTRSDVFGGVNFLENERTRTVSLNRLSQPQNEEEGHSGEYENPMLYEINGTQGRMTGLSKNGMSNFAANDPRQYFQSLHSSNKPESSGQLLDSLDKGQVASKSTTLDSDAYN